MIKRYYKSSPIRKDKLDLMLEFINQREYRLISVLDNVKDYIVIYEVLEVIY